MTNHLRPDIQTTLLVSISTIVLCETKLIELINVARINTTTNGIRTSRSLHGRRRRRRTRCGLNPWGGKVGRGGSVRIHIHAHRTHRTHICAHPTHQPAHPTDIRAHLKHNGAHSTHLRLRYPYMRCPTHTPAPYPHPPAIYPPQPPETYSQLHVLTTAFTLLTCAPAQLPPTPARTSPAPIPAAVHNVDGQKRVVVFAIMVPSMTLEVWNCSWSWSLGAWWWWWPHPRGGRCVGWWW